MENIALIISSLKGGGAERVVSILSKELSKKYNVYIILFDSNDIAYSYGGDIIGLDIKANNNIMIKFINSFRRTRHLRKIKKDYKIDCSISFMESANITNVLSKYKDKVIISIRSHLSKRNKTFINKVSIPIVASIYRKSDKLIGVSKGVAVDSMNVYNLEKSLVTYIHNPIDIEKIQELSLNNNFDKNLFQEDDFTIINVGRLTDAKGQWHLIRAISYVKRKVPNVKLLLLGTGDLEKYLKKLVVDLDLNNNVLFLGHKKNPFKYMINSDIFVLSSLYEGFSNVILEAMATGTAIISTDCRSGSREIIAPKTNIELKSKDIEYEEYGILVPVCDGKYYDAKAPLTKEEIILARSILILYNNPYILKKYSKKSKERSLDFTVDNIVKQWEEFFYFKK